MPATLNTLAPELLIDIAEYLPIDALQALLRCNRFLYHLLLRSLYERAVAAVPGLGQSHDRCPWMRDARQVALSLAAGLDVNMIVDLANFTRLHTAVCRFALEPLDLLYWRTSHQSELDVLRLLLAHGADVHAKTRGGQTRGGQTPLHLLVSYPLEDKTWSGTLEDDGEPLKLLLRYGADVNAVNNLGESPLHRAVKANNHQMAALLLENGADVNKTDVLEISPLMVAVRAAQPRMVAFLLEHGADPHRTNVMKLYRGCYKLDDSLGRLSEVMEMLSRTGVQGPSINPPRNLRGNAIQVFDTIFWPINPQAKGGAEAGEGVGFLCT